MKFSTVHKHKGSALLLTLWALLILAGAVIVWAKYVQQQAELTYDANMGLEATALAHSGISVAMHPDVTRESPVLEHEFDENRRYEVKVISEGAKLNLPWLLAGEDPIKIGFLINYLDRRRGIEMDQREIFLDCLLDWVDGDPLKRINGAENEPGYEPPNRMLETMDELYDIKGTEPLVSQAGWENDFTLFSRGPIDINAAPYEILQILPGIGDLQAERILEFRFGDDREEGTIDDRRFKDIEDLRRFLRYSEEQFAELKSLISVNDPTMQIKSTGYAGKVKRKVEVIVQKTGPVPNIMLWKE